MVDHDRRENDKVVLQQLGVMMDALYGRHRPPLHEDTAYWYEGEIANGMSGGLVSKVRENSALLGGKPKISIPWQFYGTVVGGFVAIVVAMIQGGGA